MWCCVGALLVPDTSKDCSSFDTVDQSNKNLFLGLFDPEYEL